MRNLYKEYEFSDEQGKAFIRQSLMNEIVFLKSKIKQIEIFLNGHIEDVYVDRKHFN